MAKFRTNHKGGNYKTSNNKGKSPGGLGVVRLVVGFMAILIVLFLLSKINVDSWEEFGSAESSEPNASVSQEKLDGVEKSFYPESTTGDVISHRYYTLSYDEDHEQAEWVAYKLTADNLRKPRVPRAKRFNPDKSVKTTSAYHNDYSHSGYTRGHLAPAGDMAHNTDAMRESFYMSNMTPQVKECNGGIWRELEETVRDWALKDKELYIVTGAVLNDSHIIDRIGRNEVSVSDLFYKVIIDVEGSEKKGIAFLIPNEKSEKPLKEYIVSIDEVEKMIGINLFADFLDPDVENEIEKMNTTMGWKFDKKRFNKRVKKWNNF